MIIMNVHPIWKKKMM
uniref:Uncharacterized protein n=1 Tax=Vitis vinifera TaxID=29760 RepID=F6H1U1_VITVI